MSLLDLSEVYGSSEELLAEIETILEAVQTLFDLSVVNYGAANVICDYVSGTQYAPIEADLVEQVANLVEVLLDRKSVV